MILTTIKINNNKVIKDNINRIIKNLFKFKKSKNNKFKNLLYISNIRTVEKFIFLISNFKKFLNFLKQIFIKALYLQNFDQKYYM